MIIAPGEGDTALALAGAAKAAGWTVVLARKQAGAEGTATTRPAAETSGFSSLPWNPSSYVSAGALAIGASSRGDVEAVVLISAPEPGDRSLFDGPPGSLASALEEALTGPVWLAREMLRRFEIRKTGKLLALSVEVPMRPSGAPGEGAWTALVSSAFRGFGEGLFDRGRGAHWKAWGIADKSGKPSALADFAIALLEEGKESKSGRWLPFTGKGGIFGIF